MAHTLLYILGYNAPEDRILPEELRLVESGSPVRCTEEDDSRVCGPGWSISTWLRTTQP